MKDFVKATYQLDSLLLNNTLKNSTIEWIENSYYLNFSWIKNSQTLFFLEKDKNKDKYVSYIFTKKSFSKLKIKNDSLDGLLALDGLQDSLVLFIAYIDSLENTSLYKGILIKNILYPLTKITHIKGKGIRHIQFLMLDGFNQWVLFYSAVDTIINKRQIYYALYSKDKGFYKQEKIKVIANENCMYPSVKK